jgi:8-oxo-dGTP pyrophosphatase MutT (NUDIX family)
MDVVGSNPGRARRGSLRQVFHHSAGAIVFDDGNCLVVRSRRRWVFPKGHLEAGESAESAAVREVREETGLDIEIDGPLGETRFEYRDPTGRHRKVVDWFVAHRVGGELTPEPIFDEALFLPVEEALALLTHDEDRALLERASALPERS